MTEFARILARALPEAQWSLSGEDFAGEAEWEAALDWSASNVEPAPTLAQILLWEQAFAAADEAARHATVSARQIRLALMEADMLAAVEAAIVGWPDPAVGVTWEYATRFYRDDPLVAAFAALLEQDDAAVEALFARAAVL